MLLGVHLIARNEADVLGRCLQSVKTFADEIIVVDTGSTDGTVEIALRFGARVIEAVWEDDFAKARNLSLMHARTLWVLMLDADEWVAEPVQTGRRLREELKQAGAQALHIRMEHQVGDGGTQSRLRNEALRVFRADRDFMYEGEIHEQLIRPADHKGNAGRWTNVDGPLSESGLTIQHDGYLRTVIEQKGKAERNLRIIARQLSKRPDDPFCLYNYGVTMCQLSRLEEAREAFEHSLEEVRLDAPYRPTLVRDYAKLLLALNHAEEALVLLILETVRYSDYADLQLLQGDAYRVNGLLQEAKQAYEAALATGASAGKYISEDGSGGLLARCAIAEVLLELEQFEQAQLWFEDVLTERPLWEEACCGLVESMQLQGLNDVGIHERLGLAVGQQHGGNATIARCFTKIGAFSTALPIWRSIVDMLQFGNWPLQDIRLFANTLIGIGQYGEAADVLSQRLLLQSDEMEIAMTVEMAWDVALCYWNEARALSGEEIDFLAQRIQIDGGDGWLIQLQAAVLSGSEQGDITEVWRNLGGIYAKNTIERVVSLGMLQLGIRLTERDAQLERHFEHALYDEGYKDTAAEWMLRRYAVTGELNSGHWFRLGELLYNKGLYSEALGMFERGTTAGNDEEADAMNRSQLAAAAASLQLALAALQLSGPLGSRSWDGSWAESDAVRLQGAIKRLDALGWKTKWNGLQRRRSHGQPAEAHFLMHDR